MTALTDRAYTLSNFDFHLPAELIA